MKIYRIAIQNFRMLKELEVDLEDTLSLVIGKNNTGKTSFLAILDKFLSGGKPEFNIEDFNIDVQSLIQTHISNPVEAVDYQEISVSLKLYISYDKDKDYIGDIANLFLDLDPNKHHLIILFDYVLDYERYRKLAADYNEYKKSVDQGLMYFLGKHINQYFKVRIKSLEYENEKNYKIISDDIVKSVISMRTISAKREVANDQGKSKSLSALSYKYYNASDSTDPVLIECLR